MITEINHEFRLHGDIQDIRVKSKKANKNLKGKLRNLRTRSTEIFSRLFIYVLISFIMSYYAKN
jgi:hypothetical protein